MDIFEVNTKDLADQFWREHGPPTAVERHMAIKVAKEAIIQALLSGQDHNPALLTLKKLTAQ